MSIERITISVPKAVAARIKSAAGDTPVSAWVTSVIEDHLDDSELERLYNEFYARVHPQPADIRRAQLIFRKLTKRPRRKSAA